MLSSDDEEVLQNVRNSVVDLQLTGTPMKLHERPEAMNSRPNSRSEYLTRPMSAVPAYFKERGRHGLKERPRSAGNSALKRRAAVAARSRLRTNSASNISKGVGVDMCRLTGVGRWSCSEMSLEPGLAAKPPLPPARPSLSHSLDDIVNIKFLRWFPESHASDREREREDEGAVRCDSSLGNDDTSDLASSDSRLGFTSPDIALNSDGNLRPHHTDSPQHSPHCKADSVTPRHSADDSPSVHTIDTSSPLLVGTRGPNAQPETPLDVRLSDKTTHVASECAEYQRQRSAFPPVLSKRERNSRHNSDSTSVSGPINKSRSSSIGSEETVCRNTISESCPAKNNATSYDDEKEHGLRVTTAEFGNSCQADTNNHRTERNTTIDRLFSSNDSLFEINVENDLFCVGQSTSALEPAADDLKVTSRDVKFRFGSEQNCTPDFVTTPSPEPRHNGDRRRMKRVTIDLCSERTQSDGKPSLSGGDTLSQHHELEAAASVQVVSKHDEILSWMVSSSLPAAEETSTYDELFNMIRVIEHDEVQSIKLEGGLSTSRATSATNDSVCSDSAARPSAATPGPPRAASDILSLLDGVEEASRRAAPAADTQQPFDSDRCVALAHRCMALSDRLESEKQRCASLTRQLSQSQQSLHQMKSESESAAARHQTFVNQLMKEKRALGEECAALVQQVEARHRRTVKTLSERHAVQLKKQEERLAAAERLRREKWVDVKTKKIKEMTVAGVEGEVSRLSAAHQDQLRELRRRHEQELARLESVWTRRVSQARQEAASDREAALTQQRESHHQALQAEVSRLEEDGREARRRLLQELREEKQHAELQMERTLAGKSSVLDSKYQQALAKLDDKLLDLTRLHQEELKSVRESVETERQAWLKQQVQALADNERQVRAEASRERDRHIEAAIRKLDHDASEQQRLASDTLLKSKESWQDERNELESEIKQLKRKLKDAKRETDEAVEQLESERSRAEQEREVSCSERARTEARLAALQTDMARDESLAADRAAQLQQQLAQARNSHRQALADKQAQLDLLYNRVKEAVAKRDGQMRLLQHERDSALDQCRQLGDIVQRTTAQAIDSDDPPLRQAD